MSTTAPTMESAGFRHEVLLYEGLPGFVAGTTPMIRDAVAAEEPVLVVVTHDKIDLLRDELGTDAKAVDFADMGDLGRNPARIIPAWQRFLDEHAGSGRALHGIGEPAHASRTMAELDECRRHESLLNVAFGDGPSWRLVCPYDASALDPLVLDEAHRTHPYLIAETGPRPSADYDEAATPFSGTLTGPPAHAVQLTFRAGPLDALRNFVSRHAVAAGLDRARLADVLLAVNEIATNSIRHGGGRGSLHLWRDVDALVCEVRDAGRIADPLVGRHRPPVHRRDGRGVWLANQLCDLVQIRSSEAGTTVRLRTRLS